MLLHQLEDESEDWDSESSDTRTTARNTLELEGQRGHQEDQTRDSKLSLAMDDSVRMECNKDQKTSKQDREDPSSTKLDFHEVEGIEEHHEDHEAARPKYDESIPHEFEEASLDNNNVGVEDCSHFLENEAEENEAEVPLESESSFVQLSPRNGSNNVTPCDSSQHHEDEESAEASPREDTQHIGMIPHEAAVRGRNNLVTRHTILQHLHISVSPNYLSICHDFIYIILYIKYYNDFVHWKSFVSKLLLYHHSYNNLYLTLTCINYLTVQKV